MGRPVCGFTSISVFRFSHAWHGTAAFGPEACGFVQSRQSHLKRHLARWVLIPAGIAVVAGFLFLTRWHTEHAAHATAPKGPLPVIMAAVLSGSGISISVMSLHAALYHHVVRGISLLILPATSRWSTPIIVGTLWPIAFMVKMVTLQWQWIAQSQVRLPETRSAASGLQPRRWSLPANAPLLESDAIGPGDHKLMAVQMDWVIGHGQALPIRILTLSPRRTFNESMPGKCGCSSSRG